MEQTELCSRVAAKHLNYPACCCVVIRILVLREKLGAWVLKLRGLFCAQPIESRKLSGQHTYRKTEMKQHIGSTLHTHPLTG